MQGFLNFSIQESLNNIDFLEYFMSKALIKAKEALSFGEFPVGCVIVYKNKIIAESLRANSKDLNETDHAEILAIKQLSILNTQKAQRLNKSELILFSTLEPCLMCLGAILINNISNIIYACEDAMGGAVNCDLSKLAPLYKNAKINIRANILRQESLKLFKDFFSNSNNSYLQNSPLSSYILAIF